MIRNTQTQFAVYGDYKEGKQSRSIRMLTFFDYRMKRTLFVKEIMGNRTLFAFDVTLR